MRLTTTDFDVLAVPPFTFRDVHHRDGTTRRQLAKMSKNIYSLFPLAGLLKACNRRYLEYISVFDDPSQGMKKLSKVSATVKESGRSYKGFNFYSEEDRKLFEILAEGGLNLKGFQNKDLREHFPGRSTSSLSRILKRLRKHGLIKKVKGSYRYYLTTLGKSVIATGLRIRNLFVIPELAGIQVPSC
jgi:DNA-binding MarR family transcriptional regulator